MKKIIITVSILVICFSANAQQKSLNIQFTDTTEAKTAIIDDRVQPFFSIMQPLEMVAKTGETFETDNLEEMRAECRLRYQKGVMEFTPPEKEALNWLIGMVQPLLDSSYQKLASIPWKFIKLNNNIEGGMPHTRGDYIFLSDTLVQMIVTFKPNAEANEIIRNALLFQIGGVMVHEQLHVFQRLNQGAFDPIYREQMNFEKLAQPLAHPWVTKHMVVNPDAPTCAWIKRIIIDNDTNYVWPIVAIKDDSPIPKMPDDFLVIGINLIKENNQFIIATDSANNPLYSDLFKVDGYYDGIPLIDRSLFKDEKKFELPMSTAYHPEEAIATIFMTVFGYDALPKELMKPQRRQINETEITRFKELFNNILN